MDTGCVTIRIQVDEKFYYEMLSELMGETITSEYELVRIVKEYSEMKREYQDVQNAMESVRSKGYGVVNPKKEEILVDEPVLIKQGSKFGVKIHSEAPSIHMIRANIETEIAPIVGNEQQANDLVRYIKENSRTQEGIWGTNIFGKSIEEITKWAEEEVDKYATYFYADDLKFFGKSGRVSALTATALKVPRSLFTTRVASASPSMSSAMMRSSRPP